MQCFAQIDIRMDKWGDGQISMYDVKQDMPEKTFFFKLQQFFTIF